MEEMREAKKAKARQSMTKLNIDDLSKPRSRIKE